MTEEKPLALFETDVPREWIDLNGHLNVTYFVRAFDLATDAFTGLIGIGWDYTKRERRSIFMLEAHISYLDEVRQGERLRITTQLLDCDAKRIHIFHEMFHGAEARTAATSEWLAIHVDMAARRSVAIPAFARERLSRIMSAHERLPRPEKAGHVIGIRRRMA